MESDRPLLLRGLSRALAPLLLRDRLLDDERERERLLRERERDRDLERDLRTFIYLV